MFRLGKEEAQISCASKRPNVQRTNYQLNFKSCLGYPISIGQLLQTRKGTVVWASSPVSAHSKSPGIGEEEHDQEASDCGWIWCICAHDSLYCLMQEVWCTWSTPPALGWSLLQIPEGFGILQAPCTLWGPQHGSWRNCPSQPKGEIERMLASLHKSSKASRNCCRLCHSMTVSAPLPRHGLHLHLLDLWWMHDPKTLVGALIIFSYLSLCCLNCVTAKSVPRLWVVTTVPIPYTQPYDTSPKAHWAWEISPPSKLAHKLALNFLPPNFFNNCSLEKSALYFPSKLWNPLPQALITDVKFSRKVFV